MNTNSTVGKKRLDYIDFMKGICILLIVQTHIDGTFFDTLLPGLNNALQSFRVPMYYFLSGVFFKLYDGLGDFTRKKVNNMIIPLFFFVCVSLLFALMVFKFKSSHGMASTAGFEWSYFFEPITKRDWHFTFPMWFLLSLFEVNIIYYVLQRYLNQLWQTVIVVMLATIGYTLAIYGKVLPLQLDTAFIGLPYFILGSFIKRHNLLRPSRYDKWGLIVLIPVLFAIYFISGKIDIHYQKLPDPFRLYLVPAIAILTLFFACKNMRYVPVTIRYFGRYSLIILGTHGVLAKNMHSIFVSRLGDTPLTSFIAFLGLMAIEAVLIVICVKFFPWFTAQKEFFKHGWTPFWMHEKNKDPQ